MGLIFMSISCAFSRRMAAGGNADDNEQKSSVDTLWPSIRQRAGVPPPLWSIHPT
jgi:hypothetical protein